VGSKLKSSGLIIKAVVEDLEDLRNRWALGGDDGLGKVVSDEIYRRSSAFRDLGHLARLDGGCSEISTMISTCY